MFYRDRRPRRRHRGFWFIWPFFFLLIFGFSHHGFFGIITGLVMLILLGLIIRALLWPLLFGAGIWGLWSSMNNRPSQQPYQNQQYQQPYQQDYQSYQQGYQPRQPAPETYQEGGRQYQYPQQSQYDQYEQPHAQYPQEMPPMEQ